MSRPRLTTNYHGRRLGPRDLIQLLEDSLDSGRPGPEAADDIRLIASKLEELAVPKTGPRQVLNRLRVIDRSRSVWGWDEFEDELHAVFQRIISRYAHTHRPPRRIPATLRRQLVPASRIRKSGSSVTST